MVANAAPRTPMWNTNMKSGSKTIFTMAPRPTVSMPIFPKPWAFINGFIPRPIITKRLHRMYIVMYWSAYG